MKGKRMLLLAACVLGVLLQLTAGVKALEAAQYSHADYSLAKGDKKETIGEDSVSETVSVEDGVEETTESLLEGKGKSSSTLRRKAYHADPKQNHVTGIDPSSEYTTASRICFQACGDGMDNTSPREGDTRYFPSNWMVLENRSFEKDSYEAAFRISEAGGFTLTVVFAEQEFSQGSWRNTGKEDKAEIPFDVFLAEDEQISTSVVSFPNTLMEQEEVSSVRHSSVALTGDKAPVMELVFALLFAGTGIAAVLFARSRE